MDCVYAYSLQRRRSDQFHLIRFFGFSLLDLFGFTERNETKTKKKYITRHVDVQLSMVENEAKWRHTHTQAEEEDGVEKQLVGSATSPAAVCCGSVTKLFDRDLRVVLFFSFLFLRLEMCVCVHFVWYFVGFAFVECIANYCACVSANSLNPRTTLILFRTSIFLHDFNS